MFASYVFLNDVYELLRADLFSRSMIVSPSPACLGLSGGDWFLTIAAAGIGLIAGYYWRAIRERFDQASPLQSTSADPSHSRQTLEYREHAYRDAIELANAVPYYQNYLTNTYDFFGEEVEALTGYKPEEFNPATWQSLVREIIMVGPFAGMQPKEAVRRARSEEGLNWRADYRIETTRGEEKWIANAAVQIRDEQGVVIGCLGILQDITEWKMTESALRDERDRAQQYLDIAGVIIVVLDRNGVVTLINRMGCQTLGYPEEEIIGFPWFEKFIAPSDRKTLSKAFQTLLENETEKYEWFENGVVTQSGEIREILWRNRILYDSSGAVVGTLSSGEDVTERKRAERALRDSEARYRSIVEDQTDFVVRWNRDFTIQFANQAYCQYFGLTRKQVIGVNFLDLIPDADRESVVEKIRSLTKDHPTREDEHRAWRHGEIVWQHWIDRAIFDETGKVLEYQSVGRDITDRKNAEMALQESQLRLELALQGANLGIWDWYPQTGLAYVNEQWENLLGYSMPEFTQSIEMWLSLIHPDDKRAILRAWYDHLRGRTPMFEMEYRLMTKTGEWKWVLDRGKVVERDESGKPVRASGSQLDITDRKLFEHELAERNDFIETILNNLPIGIAVNQRLNGEALYINDRYVEIHGWPREVLKDRNAFYHYLFPDPVLREYWMKRIYDDIVSGDPARMKWDGLQIANQNQDQRTINLSCIPIETQQINIFAVIDVSEQKQAEEEKRKLEDQLRQTQKIDAVGRLAGGIAHDFNNLLVAILGYSDMAVTMLDAASPVRKHILEVKKAGERAEALTRQLLAFSRKQVMQPRVIDLNDLIIEMDGMLRRLIGENIELKTIPDPNLGSIVADAGQIEQVLVNLAINSRDAMPDGGSLTIETSNVELDEAYVKRHPEAHLGPHVMLAVSDDGVGMDRNTLERVFEPFFTTKEKGKGTGLGLSMVYGIVKQSGGNIWIYSEPGQGTSVKIYLPLVEGEEEDLNTPRPEILELNGNETVLVVEDETLVRELIVQTLEQHGYRVLSASRGDEALQAINKQKGDIHLLLTDVVMPGISGRELANQALKILPDMKVLYISGYTENAIVHHGVLDTGLQFLQKPFTAGVLLRKIRRILD
ncbi:MAG: PAS domain S-box protein [bacterium]|nr:PAS domain S-box protein [bacterium]